METSEPTPISQVDSQEVSPTQKENLESNGNRRTNSPANVPAGWHKTDEVPLGIQIIAPPLPNAAGEARILSLALQLERVQPWVRVAPGFAN
jgi:Asp-tRNA(Asn)/Glu-tRNA(Gln) amidotransferase A subunit family amidase